MNETKLSKVAWELLAECRQAYEKWNDVANRVNEKIGNTEMIRKDCLDDETMLCGALITAKKRYQENVKECEDILKELENEATNEAN